MILIYEKVIFYIYDQQPPGQGRQGLQDAHRQQASVGDAPPARLGRRAGRRLHHAQGRRGGGGGRAGGTASGSRVQLLRQFSHPDVGAEILRRLQGLVRGVEQDHPEGDGDEEGAPAVRQQPARRQRLRRSRHRPRPRGRQEQRQVLRLRLRRRRALPHPPARPGDPAEDEGPPLPGGADPTAARVQPAPGVPDGEGGGQETHHLPHQGQPGGDEGAEQAALRQGDAGPQRPRRLPRPRGDREARDGAPGAHGAQGGRVLGGEAAVRHEAVPAVHAGGADVSGGDGVRDAALPQDTAGSGAADGQVPEGEGQQGRFFGFSSVFHRFFGFLFIPCCLYFSR